MSRNDPWGVIWFNEHLAASGIDPCIPGDAWNEQKYLRSDPDGSGISQTMDSVFIQIVDRMTAVDPFLQQQASDRIQRLRDAVEHGGHCPCSESLSHHLNHRSKMNLFVFIATGVVILAGTSLLSLRSLTETIRHVVRQLPMPELSVL